MQKNCPRILIAMGASLKELKQSFAQIYVLLENVR